MNAVVQDLHGEVVDGEQFFAPVSSDLVDSLIGQYRAMRLNVEAVSAFVNGGENSTAIAYFLDGNYDESARYRRSVAEIFKLDGAIAHLNSTFWSRALGMTDVYTYMPAKRREEWNEQIRNPRGKKAARLHEWDIKSGKVQKEWDIEPLPDFEEDTVRSTLAALLHSRSQFFGERVDGIFTNLSGDHVTNQPQGFSKRMIIWASHKREYINDLRAVVAKFMGRTDEPTYNTTSQLLNAADRQSGQWMNIDGGSMRIRTYKKGTAHFEIHPDMAWRLNCVLASMHPMAIPAEFRQKPKKKAKDFLMMQRPLPFAVVDAIADLRRVNTRAYRNSFDNRIVEPKTTNPNSFEHQSSYREVGSEVAKVLEAIGAARFKVGGFEWFEFDFDPRDVLDQIITSGCIPDQRAHQFYPTPVKLAEVLIDMAEIEDDSICLEPSAGIGGIADLMPKDRTTCVEISSLHCKVLEAKGFKTVASDFIAFADSVKYPVFDRVVMNPPFSDGRARAHVEAAGSLVMQGGKLVAILPSGMRHKDILPGWDVWWSNIYENEFDGTTIDVVILVADRTSDNRKRSAL